MAAVSVPWAVENGAKVGAAVGRVLANVASQNREGISQPGDCKVTQTGTASQAVQISSGGLTMRNRQAPGESYIGAFEGTTTVAIDVTGTARTDMVVARVVDPDFSPWQASDIPDAVNGPYFQPFVVKGVSAGASKASDVVTYSAVALAKIAVPASGNITGAMITDLRRLYRAEKDEIKLVSAGLALGDTNNLGSVGSFAPWIIPAEFSVAVPEWATHYLARLDVTNSIHYGPNGFGTLGLFFGGSGSGNSRSGGTLVASNPWAAIGAAGTSDRVSVQSAITNGPKALPAGYAGSNRQFDLRAMKDNSSEAGYLQADAQTRAILEVTWLQQAV